MHFAGYAESAAPSGIQTMVVINESVFYHAALKSRVEKAKAFRKWVTSVMLPQIARTGGYIPVSEEDDEKMILVKALGIMKRTIEQKETQSKIYSHNLYIFKEKFVRMEKTEYICIRKSSFTLSKWIYTSINNILR